VPQKGNNSFKNFIKFQNSKINNNNKKIKVQNFQKISIIKKISKFQKFPKNFKNFKSVEHITDGRFVPYITGCVVNFNINMK
jgi:transposase